MLKIRASQVGKIMPGKRSDWLKTSEDYLFQLFVENKYGRTKEIKSKYLDKGTESEEFAITLLSDLHGILYFKNEENFEDEFNTGTPDIIQKGKCIRDIKCSWDVFTFEKAKRDSINPDYYSQLQTYMSLCNEEVAYLDYCLIDTPEHIIEREQRYFGYDTDFKGSDLLEAQEEIRKSLTFSDIAKEDRVFTIEIERSQKHIDLIHDRVELCRKKYADLTKRIKKVA